jgi:hypothetical protein
MDRKSGADMSAPIPCAFGRDEVAAAPRFLLNVTVGNKPFPLDTTGVKHASVEYAIMVGANWARPHAAHYYLLVSSPSGPGQCKPVCKGC